MRGRERQARLTQLHLEEEAEIFDGELAECRIGVFAQRGVRHRELLRLQLDNLVLDRVLDDELCDCHRAFLAQAMNTIWW